MIPSTDDVARLRRAFQAGDDLPGGEIPAPEVIWAAARGELPPEETRQIVELTARYPALAEEWRLARHLAASENQMAAGTAVWQRRYAPWAAALAAVFVLVLGGLFWRPSSDDPEPVYRGDSVALQSQVAEEKALPRERFLLRWSAGPEGARYSVQVTAETLEVIASAHDLSATEYLVPATTLGSLPDGAQLLWQVEMTSPDGRKTTSDTFLARLGP